VLFALGTHMGIRQMAVTGEHGVGEAEPRHVRSTFVTRENLADTEANYTDTHGASLVGFAFTELLGFKLLPRLKNIGAIQLYAPGPDMAAWPKLEKILEKRPIDDPEQICPYPWRTVVGPARLEDVIPGEPTFTWLPVLVRLPGRRRAVARRCSCRSG